MKLSYDTRRATLTSVNSELPYSIMTLRSHRGASGVCERLRSALTSLCCESAIVTLTLVSGLAITGEILIDYGILTTPFTPNASPQQQQTSPTNATPATPADPGGGLPSSSSDDSERVQTMEIVQKVFHYISLVIAGIFFIEIVLKLLVFRMRFLLKHWQVLDMLIVLAAVMVEVAFEIEDRIPELEAATYIVVFRLWRLPQACNIKAKSVQRTLEQDIEVWKAGKTKLEEKCASLEAKHNKQKDKIERLERELSALKKETKESGQTKQTVPSPHVPVASRNGTVPRDTADNHNHSPPEQGRKTLTPGRLTAYSEDEDTLDGSPMMGRSGERGADDMDTEEDTVDDEGDSEDVRGGQRSYFRSGSESSLSCQGALEHEVHVQIEEPTQESREEGKGEDPKAVPLRKGGRSRPVCYDNSGYSPDLEEGEIHGELVHEIDGAKTYRSAEGIPMTSL